MGWGGAQAWELGSGIWERISPFVEVQTESVTALQRRGWRCCRATGPGRKGGHFTFVGCQSHSVLTPSVPSEGLHPHQQTESVFDFLKHVCVFGLGGWLGSQRQQALCGWGAGEVVGTAGQHWVDNSSKGGDTQTERRRKSDLAGGGTPQGERLCGHHLG